MYLILNSKRILLVLALCLSKVNSADDYDEDMTQSPSLDFFDGENSEELFDPVRQQADRGFMEFLARSQRTMTTLEPPSSSEEDNTRHSHNVRQSILTTVVPDYIQSFSPTPAITSIEEPAETVADSSSLKYLDENDTISSSSMDFGFYSDRGQQQSFLGFNETNSSEDQHPYNGEDQASFSSTTNNSEDLDMRPEMENDPYEPATTTLVTPTVRTKQGKQIQIIKLLPHEALRNFVEDAYIRTPLAALVDTSPTSLAKTKALWKDALRPNAAMDVVLLAFNASGVAVTYSFKNTRTLLAGINSIKESEAKPGNAFYGIIRATELIPYDSAVFINTAIIPADTNLAQLAAITLLKKRIRLYLVWFGEKAFSENETQEVTGGVLGEVAIRSGGEILHVDDSNFQMDSDNTLTLVSKTFLQGPQEVEIPVETSISDLHIKIDSLMRTATLETPNGEINLKNPFHATNVIKGKAKSLMSNDKKCKQIFEFYIHLEEVQTPTKFYLRTTPENSEEIYRIIIEGTTDGKIFENEFELIDENEVSGNSLKSFNLVDSKLRSSVENKVLQERHNPHGYIKSGRSLMYERLRFPDDDARVETIDNSIEEGVTNSYNLTKPKVERQASLQPTGLNRAVLVDVGVQSQLLATAGMMPHIYFEVTNLRELATYFVFAVKDDRSYLTKLEPQGTWIAAGQTVTATVATYIPPNTEFGTKDRITFIATVPPGVQATTQSVELKVVSNSKIQDDTAPSLSWTFGSRCEDKLRPGVCENSIWTLEITAQDWETGILRVHSNPKGIYTRFPYTAGTSEPVRVVYSSTCCQPRVTLTAYDLASNQRVATIDVRDVVLTEASIAAIAVGAILLILLIVLLILLIVWCFRRRRESRDLSSYRSHSER